MAKAAKKTAKTAKKSARVVAKPKAAKKSAKPAARTKTATPSRPAKQKTKVSKIDPLNRKQYTSITPMLTVSDIRQMVDFYQKAFGFTVRGIMDSPQGPMHAELNIRETTLMLSPEAVERGNPSAKSLGNTPTTLYVTVENVDRIFDQAVAAGGQVLMPVTDMFWGDRCCMIVDPDGNKWMIATHKSEPTEAEMMEHLRREMQAREGGQGAASAGAAE
jgi:PhnB protein